MAKIKKLKENGKTVYPTTITQAVVDPNTGERLSALLEQLNDLLSNIDAKTLQGYGLVKAGETSSFGKIPVVGSDGVVEIGRYIDFHYSSNSNVDYNIRLACNASGSTRLAINLPTRSGTLATTYDIPSVTWPTPITVPCWFDYVDHQAFFDEKSGSAADFEAGLPLYLVTDNSIDTSEKLNIPVAYRYNKDSQVIEFYFAGSDGETFGIWHGKGNINSAIGLNVKEI